MSTYKISIGSHGSTLTFSCDAVTASKVFCAPLVKVVIDNRLDKTKATIYIDHLSALGLARWIESTVGDKVKP